jgi:hypothetical protein
MANSDDWGEKEFAAWENATTLKEAAKALGYEKTAAVSVRAAWYRKNCGIPLKEFEPSKPVVAKKQVDQNAILAAFAKATGKSLAKVKAGVDKVKEEAKAKADTAWKAKDEAIRKKFTKLLADGPMSVEELQKEWGKASVPVDKYVLTKFLVKEDGEVSLA